MVATKKNSKLTKVTECLIFLYFILFPFGQLLRVNLPFFESTVTLHPLDALVGIATVIFVLSKFTTPTSYKKIFNFLLFCSFSLLFSLSLFDSPQILTGFLHFTRLSAYVFFSLLIWRLVQQKNIYRQTLFHCLVFISLISAILGWVQYLALPDLRFLKIFGWDDHLNRLTGSFLDPGFTGIILTFGFLTSLSLYLKSKNKLHLVLPIFFVASVAFTYSRASYLALLAGFSLTLILFKKTKALFISIVLFLSLLLFLPRPWGEGVRLERTFSILSRLDNYQETFSIFKNNPLFGTGYNNLCLARLKLFGGIKSSHSCSGSDSSLLLVLATTGIVGFMIFTHSAASSLKFLAKNLYGRTFLSCTISLFIHSLFVNSLFYPWVMGWLGILFAVSVKEK